VTAPLSLDRVGRYERSRRLSTLALQDRDKHLIRLVAQHRVIGSGDLQLLVGGSAQAILRRLRLLYDHGYLDRPHCQLTRGNNKMVYALGQRGAEMIAEETGEKPIADWAEKNRQLQSHYLEHALMVSRFQVALRYAAHSLGTVVLERWCPDGFIRDSVTVEHRDRRERVPVAPDAFFTLRLLDSGESVSGFLEADRSTMPIGRFAVKLRGYLAYYRSGQQERRVGARNCLVVTITTSAERAEHLLEAARSVTDRGLRMFIFCCEQQYLPTASRRILDAIWRTPADDGLHGLLD